MNIDGNNVIVIGITGTIGAGKSTVGNILTQLGVPIIDTDKIVHQLLDSDNQVKTLVAQRFPTAINAEAKESGIQISRKVLGTIIFNDAIAKKQLELILHPRVRQICQQQIKHLVNGIDKPAIIAVLVPLLFENNLQSQYDQTWTIVADDKTLRQRLMKRDGLSAADIDLRLAGQMTQVEKAKLADFVLDNSSDENKLREKVAERIKNFCD